MRAVLLLIVALPAWAGAATLRDISVDHVDGTYVMRSEVWFDVGIEKIYGLLLDWDQSPKFSSVIKESRNLEPAPDGRGRYYSRTEGCLWFFCKSFERYGYVEHEPLTQIEAYADPAKSDFELSDERWEFREEAGGTVVIYAFKMKPKFFIPPLIGPAILKNKLRNGGADAIQRIEALARDYAPYED
ncbi:MAG TPA: SRPBCC family protein [Woeseiaceae bacterium]|nr:SRPBCC family protein [Woeseiaceae bacterium]